MIISQVFFDTIDMEAVDDLAVVSILLQVLLSSVEVLQFLEEKLPEGFTTGVVDEDVIDTDAGLPAVEELTKQDTVDCYIQVSSLIHDGGALASELQNAGDEVLGGFNGHEPTSLCRASEADHIDWQLDYCLGHLYSSLNDSEES